MVKKPIILISILVLFFVYSCDVNLFESFQSPNDNMSIDDLIQQGQDNIASGDNEEAEKAFQLAYNQLKDDNISNSSSQKQKEQMREAIRGLISAKLNLACDNGNFFSTFGSSLIGMATSQGSLSGNFSKLKGVLVTDNVPGTTIKLLDLYSQIPSTVKEYSDYFNASLLGAIRAIVVIDDILPGGLPTDIDSPEDLKGQFTAPETAEDRNELAMSIADTAAGLAGLTKEVSGTDYVYKDVNGNPIILFDTDEGGGTATVTIDKYNGSNGSPSYFDALETAGTKDNPMTSAVTAMLEAYDADSNKDNGITVNID